MTFSNIITTLHSNLSSFVGLLDSWVKSHDLLKCKLDMAEANLPPAEKFEGENVCGTCACHAGWSYAILKNIDVNQLTHGSSTSYTEDNHREQAWKFMIDNEHRHFADYNLGKNLLGIYLGFNSGTEMTNFFDAHRYIIGVRSGNDLFSSEPCSEPFWAQNKHLYQLIVEEKKLENDDLRIIYEYWTYTEKVLRTLQDVIYEWQRNTTRNIGETLVASTLSLYSINNLEEIHKLLYDGKVGQLNQMIDKMRTSILN